MKRAVNIKSIAAHCNVAVSTVSRVINGRPDVSDETRRRVQQAVLELGFVPNNSARNLAKITSDSIVVVVHGLANPFFSEIINEIETCISSRGYTMILHQISTAVNETSTAATLVSEHKPRGVLFLGGRFDQKSDETAELDVPFVCASFTNTFGDLDESEYSSVAIDDEREAYNAVSYLQGMGHTKIAAIIAHEHDRSICDLRLAGYKRALFEANIASDDSLVAVAGSFDPEDAYRATLKLLDDKAEFTAVFAITDLMAIAAMKALSDRGLNVPDDVSVMGIDGIEMTRYFVPSLTTLEQPAKEIASKSASMLFDLINEKGKNAQVTLKAKLREGGSVAAAAVDRA